MEYTFTVTIRGSGINEDEAWNDAVGALAQDAGPVPDDYEISDDNE